MPQDVDYGGEVCNTTGVGDPNSPDYKPPLNLSGVMTVTDDPSGNVHNIGTLVRQTAKDYSGSYTPSSAGSEEPGAISFSDTVTATGTAPLGFAAHRHGDRHLPALPDLPGRPHTSGHDGHQSRMKHRAMVQTMALLHGIKAGCLLPICPSRTPTGTEATTPAVSEALIAAEAKISRALRLPIGLEPRLN